MNSPPHARSGSDLLSFILAVVFIVVPTSIMLANTMAAARERDRRTKILLTVLQVSRIYANLNLRKVLPPPMHLELCERGPAKIRGIPSRLFIGMQVL